ncbi:hypothetical protein [Nocardioides nitrophenolicus]|uniref:hypothetical protein n=1 Tax=Nocardioides nitrophenolicus TaxID=60489 RepID=UPI001956ABDD|nr:hypothetical protein [Nocardioides nitrophenolicus]MBM7516851.1 hypothetical protein [Nocardioides nitrophenolicus]
MRTLALTVTVLLATLVAPFAIAGSWLTARVDDRAAYVDTVGGLADDPTVRRVLADAAADGAVEALQENIPFGLPSGVRTWADQAARAAVESPEFPAFWRTANGDVHDQVLAVLKDPDAPADGSITVDAGPLVDLVLARLEDRGIPVGLLPDVEVRVPVERESKVAEAGPAYRAVDGVSRLLPFVWIGLVVIALIVARGWRAEVRALGFALLGVALAAAGLLAAANPLGTAVLDRVQVERRELAGVLVDTVIDSLEPYARGFLLAAVPGLVLVLVGLWSGRRAESPVPEPDWH